MSWTSWSRRFARPDPISEEHRRDMGFEEWLRRFHPRFRLHRVHLELVGVLQKVADGQVRRLMIFLPPRHGKSETVSRLFSAYFAWRFPDRFVALSSYSAELAYSLSRAARDNFSRSGGELDPAARAVKHWQTREGGGLWATGVGGPATGKGFHLGIADDPLKNAKEAQSPVIRTGQTEWLQSVWMTREEPDGAQVYVMTRWHEEDICGWLIAEEAAAAQALEDGDEDAIPESWYIVYLPAIAEPEADRPPFPSTCTVHPEWREPGEALCPERYPLQRLRTIMKRIGAYFWEALFQQRPSPKEGSFFNVSQIGFADALPASAKLNQARAWDLGASTDGDPTASVRMAGPCSEGLYYVLDCQEFAVDSAERDRRMIQAARTDGTLVRIRGPQDPGQAGKDQVRHLRKLFAGFTSTFLPVTGSKEVRAGPLSSAVNAGNVRIVAPMARHAAPPPWAKVFLERLRTFPNGPDDVVDAAADAYRELTARNTGGARAGGSRDDIAARLGD